MTLALDEMGAKFDALEKRLDELNKPDFSAVREEVASDREAVLKALGADKAKGGAWVPPRDYKPFGEFKSFGQFIRDGFNGKAHETPAFRERVVKAIQGMSEAVGSDGGFTVLPEFNQGILERVYQNDILSRTDQYTVGGNSMTFMANSETSRANGSRHGGVRQYWVGEADTLTKSKPTFRELQLKLHKSAVLVYLTQELIDDTSMALEQYVTRKAADEFNFADADAIFNGSGVAKPQGFLNSPALVTVSKETGQAADTIQYENIVKMWSRMYAPSRANSVWFINQDCEPALNTMSAPVGTGGVPVYLPPGGLSSAPYGTLMGRPVIATEFNATLGDVGDIVLADLGQYITISKGGIRQDVSMHVEFLTDQLALRFIRRIDGCTWENSAITPYKGTATQSSFVALEAR